MNIPILILTVTAILTTTAISETRHQPYKGYEAREISSLSANDIEELKKGAGWGLALPAELNGYPGPAHVLELREELELTDQQFHEFQSIFDSMKSEAVTAGHALIEAEHNLEQAFKSGDLSPEKLRELIINAENARADLRFIHLSRHLHSIDKLTPRQVSLYSKLRGYTSDSCKSVPAGHNEEMWRRHNGCDS